MLSDESVLQRRQKAQVAGMGAKQPKGMFLGVAEHYPGLDPQVPRLPGGVRDALDWARHVTVHSNALALGIAIHLHRLTAFPDCESSVSRLPRALLLQKGDRIVQHQIGSREEWLAARIELLKKEKELTRLSDELSRQRQALPWVRVDKQYRFETDEGAAALADLFGGRSQLLIYHFMFGPDYKAGCASCSSMADGFNGFVVHLANHDVTLLVVSQAPIAKLRAYKQRMGWTFPWASSLGGDFNSDFNVSFTEEQQREGIEYNYRREKPWIVEGIGDSLAKRGEGPVAQHAAMSGADVATYTRERPGMSAFVIEDGIIYHTYSTFARGLDGLWGMYQWLDRAPKGRNETDVWLRHRDEYGPLDRKGGSCCHS